jgi:hypothetical protein
MTDAKNMDCGSIAQQIADVGRELRKVYDDAFRAEGRLLPEGIGYGLGRAQGKLNHLADAVREMECRSITPDEAGALLGLIGHRHDMTLTPKEQKAMRALRSVRATEQESEDDGVES